MRSAVLIVLFLMSASARAGAQNNPHGVLPRGLDCADCHTAEGWRSIRRDPRFDHARTGFALSGKHSAAKCSSCHKALRFEAESAQPRMCADCHTDVHQARFGTDCTSCHDTRSFQQANAAGAHASTSFPLSGAHTRVPCESCHRNESTGSYTALDTRCSACHQQDYNAVQLPNHTEAGFSGNCTECHSTLSWAGAPFDHGAAANGFVLLGAHIRSTCGSCHTASGLRFNPPPTTQQECLACHNAEYQGQHAGNGYPTTCMTCHNMDTWDGAVFRHTTFALVGAHTSLQCTACHAPSNNELIYPAPTGAADCVACHLSDYERQHAGTGIATTCMSCHTVNDWTFNHDPEFPIYSGAHAGKWSNCQQCHTTPGDYRNFNCLSCHTATETNGHHREVNGYAYDSNLCYSCHPRGRS
ncbi:MAG TPA: hypothetical protein VGD27_06625 [Longimicrobiales bacterium]